MLTDDKTLERRLMAVAGGDELVRKAIGVARQVHSGALRDEGTPYISHPFRVALILIEELGVSDPQLVSAALLHDAIEDSDDMTYERLLAGFGPPVAGLVRRLTDEFRHSGLPRAERKARYLARVAGEDADCLMLKLCDRLDNLRSSVNADSGKRELMRRQTREYLMPALANRTGVFRTIETLLEQILSQLQPHREAGDIHV
jgi:guanosine-3',5'-bis(diphosphate) 3'-pyrophosphohydrolase